MTRSFGTPVTEFDVLMGAIAQYAMRAGEKLRQHGLVAGRLTVFFHTNRHRPDRPQHSASRTLAISPMSDDGFQLIAAARRGAENAWRDGFAYTKAGIMLERLETAQRRQRSLFESEDDIEKRRRLMAALDAVNGRYGKFTAVPAAQGFRRSWKLRSEMKSPAWTTRIEELPIAKA